ncbi:hypothetical protein RM555_26925 [Micromonospora sp. DSM 115977]|uniref:Uncharacterized protein n=1 Tax=Micromonospora reichwaldensis TaxID=3075516 RepID=A0ABU2X395_9ACTN|nr:hypothetical protein [Micromonospora sp. DSM 115977]MDT0532637.1 hypothetical protein [Micromonospora sp. DSM 115977]
MAAARLAAVTTAYYSPRPQLTDPAYSNLLRRAEVQTLEAAGLGRALAPLFTRDYVQRVTVAEYDTDTVERRTIARRSTPDGTRADYLPSEEFAARVALVVTDLPDPSPATSPGLTRAVRDSRALAAFGARSPWVRDVARTVAAELPHLADVGATLYRDGEPERPAAGWTPERRREYDRGRRVPRDASEQAALWLTRWREVTAPGAHPAPEVFRRYVAAAERLGVDRVGRNQFYKLAEEVLGPRKRRAAGPVFVVPEEVAPMDRTQRRDLAALIVDRLTEEWRTAALDGLAELVAEHQAEKTAVGPMAPAIGTRGQVVDLAAHRARRRVA